MPSQKSHAGDYSQILKLAAHVDHSYQNIKDILAFCHKNNCDQTYNYNHSENHSPQNYVSCSFTFLITPSVHCQTSQKSFPCLLSPISQFSFSAPFNPTTGVTTVLYIMKDPVATRLPKIIKPVIKNKICSVLTSFAFSKVSDTLFLSSNSLPLRKGKKQVPGFLNQNTNEQNYTLPYKNTMEKNRTDIFTPISHISKLRISKVNSLSQDIQNVWITKIQTLLSPTQLCFLSCRT